MCLHLLLSEIYLNENSANFATNINNHSGSHKYCNISDEILGMSAIPKWVLYVDKNAILIKIRTWDFYSGGAFLPVFTVNRTNLNIHIKKKKN